MGSWYNLDGIDLVNCVNDRCGKRPSLSDPKYATTSNSGFGTTTGRNTNLFNQDVAKYQECVDVQQPYCEQLKKLGSGATSTSSSSTRTPTASEPTAQGDKVLIDKFNTNGQSAQVVQSKSNMILFGILILGVGIGAYFLLKKKKA